jgi:hypothetical protein
MSSALTLTFRWPEGRSLSVALSPVLNPEAAINLILPGRATSCDTLLIFKGKVLDNSLSLEFQGVRTGDTLFVYQRKKLPVAAAVTSFDTKIRSVLLEVLRINDNYYQSIETHPKGGLMYQRLREAGEVDPWDGFRPPPDETALGTATLGEAALPPLVEDSEPEEDDYSDDPGFPMFGSIEEAGKFFSKHPWNEWAW